MAESIHGCYRRYCQRVERENYCIYILGYSTFTSLKIDHPAATQIAISKMDETTEIDNINIIYKVDRACKSKAD
jgi:hypothetical protein